MEKSGGFPPRLWIKLRKSHQFSTENGEKAVDYVGKPWKSGGKSPQMRACGWGYVGVALGESGGRRGEGEFMRHFLIFDAKFVHLGLQYM